MSEPLPFNLPVHAYVWGPNFEIRDPQNKVVLRLQVLKRDYSYLKQMEAITKIVTGLMNGEMWVEQGDDGYKLLAFGTDGEQVSYLQAPIASKPEPEQVAIASMPHETIPDVSEPEIEPEPEQEEDQYSGGRIGGFKPKAILERQEVKRKRGRPPKVK